MVGLYGDPTVSWSILLEARLREPARPDEVESRLAEAALRHPHLGQPPAVQVVDPAQLPAVRTGFADRLYRDGEPLIRVAAGSDRLLIAAHHGVVDGLGLLAVLGLALGTPVSSNARGIGVRPAARGFVSSSALRLWEAVFTPPTRAAGSGAGADAGDALATVDLPARRLGSTALTVATTGAVRRWNQRRGVVTRRVVAALGASRRPGTTLAPDRCTAFYRLWIPTGADSSTVRRLLDQATPEPDFPQTGGRVARPLIRALTNRLGATFLASNLGVVRAGPQVASLAFHPVASGNSGIAVGAATCGETTTITIRARRTSFDDAAASELLGLVVDELTSG